MKIISDSNQSNRIQKLPLNHKKEHVNLNQVIIYLCWDSTNKIETILLSKVVDKLKIFQFVLPGNFDLSNISKPNQLYDNLYFHQEKNTDFYQEIDLVVILDQELPQVTQSLFDQHFFSDNTVAANIPILYFCRDSKNSDVLCDHNIYVISEQPNPNLLSSLIERFFDRSSEIVQELIQMLDAEAVSPNRNIATLPQSEKMIEEQTVSDYSARATSLQNQGDIEGAIQHYFNALKQESHQPLWVFDNLAECLINTNELQRALDIIQTGLRLYSQAASLYRFRGVVQDRQGNINDVIFNYVQAIELNENQPFWVYCVLADYYQRQGKLEESHGVTLQGLRLYPQQADIYRCLGVIQDRQGNIEETISSYQKAIALDPSQPFWVYCALIERLNSQSHSAEAIVVGQQGIKQYPEQSEIYYHLGAAQDRQNDIVGVTDSYLKAIKLKPKQPVHLYLILIEKLLAQDRIEGAVKLINRASKIYPEHSDSFRASYHKILEIRPTDLKLYKNLAFALQANNEIGEAVAVYHKGLLMYPDDQELQKGLDVISPSLNHHRDSQNDVGVAVDLSITPLAGWQFYHELGHDLQKKGKLEEAVAAYQQSIVRNPSYGWSYHNLGDTQLRLGKWEDAIASYQRAIELNPDYFWSNYNLGKAYNNSGRWGEAIKLYHRSIELNPSQHLPYEALKESLLKRWNGMFAQGDMLLKQNNRVEANAIFRQAIKLFRRASNIPNLDLAQEIPQNPRVVLIVDDYLSQCLRYRVEQKVEQLEYAGVQVEYFPWRDVKLAKSALHFAHAVIFYRVPALPDLIETIEYAKSINKVVFYEIDDLIFNAKEYPDPLASYGGQVDEEQYRGLIRGTTLFHEAMALCDYGIASTPALAKEIGQVVQTKTCFVHRNALDSLNYNFVEQKIPKIKRDYISIFYGSGTKAHNADFEELVAPAIAKILQQNSQVRLTLMGYLVLPKILLPYQEQIDKVDLIKDVTIYWEFLRQADINIAMLLPTTVNNCKSELKWFEAGSLGVPSIVSNTSTYLEVLNDGVDALIASTPQDWYVHLKTLVDKPELRKNIGQAAYERVWQEYSLPTMANNIKQIVMAGIEQETKLGKLKHRTNKKKLLIVNVFYPPQSIGGATRIVKDNVDVLQANYSDQYEISIFTTDNGNPNPYEILEYSHEGVKVTKVSSPMMEGMDWQYQNPRMFEIFSQYLEFNKPDLIHFHCIQRLTGSVLEAAIEQNIPYVVTAHDAWWISDHQFLVNEKGIECDYNQNDPVVTAYDAKDIVKALKRKRYLKQQLSQATKVLAVSEAFTEIYLQNDINNTHANRNGIIPQKPLPRKPSPSGKVRLAHIGGMAAHKGYFMFQDAVKQAKLNNCEIIVVSHRQTSGSVSHDSWGTTPVKFISKVPQTQIYELYSEIDVLLAPSMWPESFGLVTREAAAAGVWVVASDKGALAEDLVAGTNGDIFNPDQTDDLVKILQRIDQEPKRYQQLILQDLPIRTTEEQVKELTTIYQSIL